MKNIMRIILGIIVGLVAATLVVIAGCLIGATLAGEDAIEPIGTVVSTMSHDVENKIKHVAEEVGV